MNIKEIRCDSYTAKINLSRGANCIGLVSTKYGANILREPDYENLDNPFLYGMPVLFPPNRISGARFIFEGREYTFPVNEEATGCLCHGFLHETEFKLVSKTENRIVCSYVADKLNPYMTFPHEFELRLIYTVSDGGLEIQTEIINNSSENMPAFLAFHTTFNLPFLKDAASEDIRFFAEVGDEYERDINFIPTGRIIENGEELRQINEGGFKPHKTALSKHCPAAESGRMEIWDIKNKLKIVYKNDSQFKFRMIYKSDDKSYICPEPQTCLTNCVNMDLDSDLTGFDYIPPGGKKVYTSRISVEEM